MRFQPTQLPVLPFIDRSADGSVRFFKRNPKLFAPRDFDYSPYFKIIKYPYLGLDDLGVYRKLPWGDDDLVYNDEENFRDRTGRLDVVPEKAPAECATKVESARNRAPVFPFKPRGTRS